MNALLFSLHAKVSVHDQVLDHAAQMPRVVGSQVGGVLESSVGWNIWGSFSEEPESLKMSLEKRGGGRRTPVGTECSRLWRWEWMRWAQVEVLWIMVSQKQKVHSEEEEAWFVSQPNDASCFPPLNSCGDQPYECKKTHWKQEFGSPADHADEKFFSSHI